MKEPEKYLSYKLDAPVFKATIKSPIIKLTDVEFIIGKNAFLAKDGVYYFEFEKQKHSDRLPWRVNLLANTKGYLTEFELPKKLTTIIGNTVIQSAIKAIGYAEVSIREKCVYLDIKDKITIDQVRSLMGKAVKKADNLYFYGFSTGSSDFNVSFETKKVRSKDLVKNLLISANGFSINIVFKVSS